MGKVSEIQWTDATWNPWYGCKKVSPGCKFCYMYREKYRYKQDPTKVLRSKTNFNAPTKWKDGRLIFTCSWSDWFIEEADQWRNEAWEIIRDCPQHTFQILTKRPERIAANLPTWFHEIAKRVWIGTSVESQKQVGRIKTLSESGAYNTFVSFEPLLGEIEWDDEMKKMDWIIIGGESGNDTGKWRYRPMEIEWLRKLVHGAIEDDIPCFVKQLGTHLAKSLNLKDRHGGNLTELPDDFPRELRLRQFPSGFYKHL